MGGAQRRTEGQVQSITMCLHQRGGAAYNSRSNEKYLGQQESNQPSRSILTFLPELTQAKLKHATPSFKMKQSYFLP